MQYSLATHAVIGIVGNIVHKCQKNVQTGLKLTQENRKGRWGKFKKNWPKLQGL